MRLRRLPQAIENIDAIWHYIARDDPNAADRMVARIIEATDRLAEYPRSGTPKPDIHRDARSVSVGRYIVLYRVGPTSVDIVGVMHASRDTRNVTFQFDD